MNKWTWLTVVFCIVVLFSSVVLLKRSRDHDVEEIKVSAETAKKAVSVTAGEISADKPVAGDNKAPVMDADKALPATKEPAEEPEPPSKSTIRPELKIDPILNTPPSLSLIMGEGENKSYFARIKEVHNLGKNLSAEEIQTLYTLLNRKDGEDNLKSGQLNALKNDVVNVLRRQEPIPAFLAHNLRAMYYDSGHDAVWRDYCIQHLGGVYNKAGSPGDIAETLWTAVRETGISIAGTALIALANNTDETYIKKDEVAGKALELVKDPACGQLARITALQICAKLGEKEALPIARSVAQSDSAVTLRMSAIAAVGTLGDESDRTMLEKYAGSSDVRLKVSAQSALERLGK